MKIQHFLAFCIPVLAAWGFFAPSAQAAARNWCKADAAPVISVKTSTDQVTWEYSRSEKELNHFSIDTVSPYGKDVITDVGGLMQGGIELTEAMRFKTLTHNGLKQICYWFESVVITLHIRPTIFIAREFPQGTCKHNAIREHELKHINVDREIVNKYANLIGEAVRSDLSKQAVFGPYKVSQGPEVEAYLKTRLENILKYYSKLMDDERRRRQQVIDSLSEYERINNMCR